MTEGKQLRDADMLRFSGGGEGALAPDTRFGPNSLVDGVVCTLIVRWKSLS